MTNHVTYSYNQHDSLLITRDKSRKKGEGVDYIDQTGTILIQVTCVVFRNGIDGISAWYEPIKLRYPTSAMYYWAQKRCSMSIIILRSILSLVATHGTYSAR